MRAATLTTDGTIINTQISDTGVASTAEDEFAPSIACEVDDYYCLVLYDYGTDDIQGQRLYMDTVGIEQGLDRVGDPFDPDPGDPINQTTDVTWSMSRGEYMAIWQQWYPDTTDYWKDRFAYIYEDDQSPGSQIKGGPYWLTSETGFGSGYEYDQVGPKVAFNNLSGNYMVTFKISYGGWSIGAGVLLYGSSIVGGPYNLDGDSHWVTQTAVAFSGGPTGSGYADDEFLAVNIETDFSSDYLQGAYFHGDHFTDDDFPIESVTGEEVFLRNPDVAGNPNDGAFLVVWEQEDAEGDRNIYAMRMGNYYNFTDIFIPLVMK